MTAKVEHLGGCWYVTISGHGSTFTKESGFDTSAAAKAWAENYAAICGTHVVVTVAQ